MTSVAKAKGDLELVSVKDALKRRHLVVREKVIEDGYEIIVHDRMSVFARHVIQQEFPGVTIIPADEPLKHRPNMSRVIKFVPKKKKKVS